MASSVHRSKQMLEEIFESGTSILSTMGGTRERLKAAQKKMLDVLNTVGLGDSLLRLIERRQRLDIWVTYGGMALMLIVTVVLVWWAWF